MEIKNKKMKNKTSEKNIEGLKYNINKAFLGIFLFIIGLVFLIDNLKIYPISIDASNFWPLLIIFIGLSFFKKRNVISTVIGSIITIICATLFFSSLTINTVNNVNFIVQSDNFPMFIAKNITTEKAEIELNAGGGIVNVHGMDLDNSVVRLVANIAESEIVQSAVGSVQKINISLYGDNKFMKEKEDFKSQFDIGIDKNTPVDLILTSGGSKNVIDLSEVKAENVKITTGASDLSLKMGDVVSSNVNVEAGASSVNLILPDTVGVKIVMESGFSSQNLPGLSLIGDKTYQSADYASKEKKINIDITMGMANLKLDWYSPTKQAEVKLFYYNQSEDRENVCDVNAILPVKRFVSENNNEIADTINLLIQGNLTDQEKAEGFTTEFPNKDFKLVKSSLDKGILTLDFAEVPGFTSGGGACRLKLLASEIIRTARQFPEVRRVVLEPDALFVP